MSAGENIARHKTLVDSEHFIAATDAALLHVQELWIQQITEPNTAMAVGLKVQGAHEFLKCLKLLVETPQVPMPKIVDNLR